VEVESEQRKCHRNGLRISGGVLSGESIDDVLMNERRVAVPEGVEAKLVELLAFCLCAF
jgi:hypothetical protein